MDNSFDRNLKQKLEGHTPEDLGYRPDRDKMWQQISGRKKKRKMAFLPWVSHAAAIAAGLLIGIVLLNRQKEDTAPVIITAGKATTAPVKIVTDTVYLPQVKKDIPLNAVVVKKETKKNPVLPQPQQMPEPYPIEERKEQPVPIFAAAVHKEQQVMYLSDMENENATPRPKARQQLAFLKNLSNQNTTGSNNETVSVMLKNNFSR